MIIRSLKRRLAGSPILFVLAVAGTFIGPIITQAEERVAYVRPEGRTQLKDIQIEFLRKDKFVKRTAEQGRYLDAGDHVRVLVSGAEATILAMDNTEIARVGEGQVVVVPASARTPGREKVPARAWTRASTDAPKPAPGAASSGVAASGTGTVVSAAPRATGKMMHNQSSAPGDSGNAQVDQLNAQSLSAAQQGQNFMPSGSASTRSAAPMGGPPMGGQGGAQGGAM